MLEYVLSDDDLSEVRFGISPLGELGLSMRAIRRPSRYPLQLPWLTRADPLSHDLDWEALDCLVDDRLWTPDFLNPRPISAATRFEDEIGRLADIPIGQFHNQLAIVHGAVPRPLDTAGRAPVRRVVSALTEYWEACFLPFWPRMRAILEADIVYRGQTLARHGLSAMLNGLADSVTFRGHTLALTFTSGFEAGTIHSRNEGIMLVPTMFTRNASAPVDLDEPPLVMYSARGQGAMWEAEMVSTPSALTELIGERRTAILIALSHPASSTELGIRFQVTASAINQHLQALWRARLVTRARHGHSILYFRSELGNALLGANEEASR